MHLLLFIYESCFWKNRNIRLAGIAEPDDMASEYPGFPVLISICYK
jgi:hypothetical protein